MRPPRLIDVVRAQSPPARTVPSVTPTSTIHQREQTQLTRSRLGRIATIAHDAGPAARTAGTLAFIAPRLVTPAGVFPLGCRTRRLDGSLRLKLQLGERGLTETLGLADGALDVVIAQGWALITQRAEQRGASRGRNSAYAAFTVTSGGVERIGLRSNHVALLGVAAGDEVLVALLPDYGALALCDPDLIAALAPAHIARLQPAPAAPVVTSVAGSDDT